MDLVTVTNDVFAPCVFNLLESYKKFSCNENVYVIYYDLKEEYINLLKQIYKNQINFVKVEEECGHAYNSRYYFPKGYALKFAAKNLKQFVMCDASHAFLNKTYELEYLLEKDTRFFIEYPEEIFKNKYWSTKKSLMLSEMDNEETKNSQSYWSGFHAYIVTDENKEMLNEQHKLMLLEDVAGPSNLLNRPDGINSECIAHRNDQTVLSLMIDKYKFRQPFDLDKYNKYGDIQTAELMLPQIYKKMSPSKTILYSRYSKNNNFSFIDKKILEQIEEIDKIYNIDRNTGIKG
jgi:hypothetical protein